MPRFAAIDVGSNASRLVIVDARDPTRIEPFRNLRVPVRLGHSVFQSGRLDPESIDHAVAAMKEFAQAIDEAEVDAYRANVTASARSASNADVLLDRVRTEAGIELQAIDGLEEARLVALAVRSKMPLVGHVLLADLGGGSLELTEVDSGTAGFSTSLPIGTVRLLEAFFEKSGRVDADREELVTEYLQRVLAPHARRLRSRPWKSIVGTGGNFEAIAKLCPATRTQKPTIDIAAARALLDVAKRLTSRERMARYGLREDRADVIVPALYVLDAIAKLTQESRVVVPGVGLKDGIVTELVAKHFRTWDYGSAEDSLFGAALQLGRRYHFDERHATQVTALATTLFDGTKKQHGLGAEDRGLLRLAALLHDIGDFVNPSSHHKHTGYLIRSSEFMGLSPEARELVATITRYHRKSLPTLRHPEYRALSVVDRRRVRVLAGLLRLADSLDRGHRSKMQGLDVSVRRGTMKIHAVADEDASLEAWTLDRKSSLLEQVLELDVALELEHPAHVHLSNAVVERTSPKKRGVTRDAADATPKKKSAKKKSAKKKSAAKAKKRRRAA